MSLLFDLHYRYIEKGGPPHEKFFLALPVAETGMRSFFLQTSVEERSCEAKELPQEQGGRLVVYKKSKRKAARTEIWLFNRSLLDDQIQEKLTMRAMA